VVITIVVELGVLTLAPLVVVVALVMVPLEVTDELLERVKPVSPPITHFSMHSVVSGVLFTLRCWTAFYNEVEQGARVAIIDPVQSQRGQFWEDRHVHRCRCMVVIVVGRLRLCASAIVIGPFLGGVKRLQESGRFTPVDLDCGDFCEVLKRSRSNL